MGNIFKGCSNDDDIYTEIYTEIDLSDTYKPYTSEGPPIFKDDTLIADNSCFRCSKELC